jgi:uncharacterized protein involved in response to NO
MTDKKDHTEINDAKQALDSIQQMQQAALLRAMPPRWFGATIALLAGSLVSLSAADLREYHVLVILAMALVISYQSHKTGVTGKDFPLKLAGLALVILLPLFFGFIIAAQLLSPTLGHTGASVLAGTLFAIAVYVLSIFERRWHSNKTDQTGSKHSI